MIEMNVLNVWQNQLLIVNSGVEFYKYMENNEYVTQYFIFFLHYIF